MDTFCGRIRSAPLVLDAEKAAVSVADLPVFGPCRELLRGAAGASPYLARLIARHGAWFASVQDEPPEQVLAHLLSELREACAPGRPRSDVETALRLCKARAALLIGLADLGGVWDLETVTTSLTALADAAVEVAARWLLAAELRAGRLDGLTLDDLDAGAGYVVLAMGKMGAGELNYSSDIDLIVLFDDSRFDPDVVLEARARYIRLTRDLVKLLSENTAGGYVFRTDLRLRPAPSTTPVCMGMTPASLYYETQGRTWERAAHIKARALVDREAGAAFLRGLEPFVWRRHLDFAAIEDTYDLIRKIRTKVDRFTVGALPGYNVKLGPGGIRAIELFVQTRQLIVGGRAPDLRSATTLGALDALAAAGWIEERVSAHLGLAYRQLRIVEHRLQMIEDAQTHQVPMSEEGRMRLAALSGASDLGQYEQDLTELLSEVHETTNALYSHAADPAPVRSPTADSALANAGFRDVEAAARHFERWREGGIAATRSDRARVLFEKIEPDLARLLGQASDPDQALVQFDRFISGLPAGVQVFSLFVANPNLLDLIVGICVAAPRLAAYLGRRPRTIDALLDRDFWEPIGDAETLTAELDAHLGATDDYERALDAARRWSREHWFRNGVHLLRGVGTARSVGIAFTAIAEASVRALLPRVIDHFATRHGPPPGKGLAVLAMGRLGTQEMTASSDLDLIVIYDADGVDNSDGAKPLVPGAYYPRLTQALVAALTAPTAEGKLYDVDMRLRPSGSKGPVAVSLPAFDQYHRNEAWVWEHLALSRARVLAGPADLVSDIDAIIDRTLAARVGSTTVLTEAAHMRRRLIDANAAERGDRWSLKLTAGGIMEIEFIAQTGALITGLGRAQTAGAVLERLGQSGWLDAPDAEELSRSLAFQQTLQHVERLALDMTIDPDGLGSALTDILVRAAGSEDFPDLERILQRRQQKAAEIIEAVFDIYQS